MKPLEAWTIAAALGLGCVTGFVVARWGRADAGESGGAARQREAAAATPVAEAAPASTSDALAAIMADPLRSRRLVALDRFCDGLDARDVREALGSAPIDSEPKNWELRARLMSRWAALDPADAAHFALGIKDAQTRSNALSQVIEVWIADAPEAAEDFVAGIRAESDFDAVMYPFVRGLTLRDPERALAFAERAPASRKGSVVWAAFSIMAGKNPSAAVARAAAMPAGKLRESAVESATNAWIETEPQAAMAWVMRQPDAPVTYGRKLLQSALATWAHEQPADAARFAQTLPAGKQRDRMIANLAGSWAFREVDPALRWAQSLPESDAKADAVQRVVRYWAMTDAPAAAAFIARQPAGEKRDEALKNVGASWAANDPAGALAWAAAQPDEAIRKNMIPLALGKLAADDPAAATARLPVLPTLEIRRDAIKEIAAKWAERAPQEAARWLLSLPAADSSDVALRDVISRATYRDPTATAHWLDELAAHPRREVMVEAFARSAESSDPPAALAWANTLKDAGKRRTLVRELVGRFAWQDGDGARAWVLGEKLEAAEQKVLLERIDQASKRR